MALQSESSDDNLDEAAGCRPSIRAPDLPSAPPAVAPARRLRRNPSLVAQVLASDGHGACVAFNVPGANEAQRKAARARLMRELDWLVRFLVAMLHFALFWPLLCGLMLVFRS